MEGRDYSTKILEHKKAPYKLLVEAGNTDNSVIEMTDAKMAQLKIF